MSRMDRYKHIHDQSKPLEEKKAKKPLSVRKERKNAASSDGGELQYQEPASNPADKTSSVHQLHQSEPVQKKKSSFFKRKNKRRKHPLLRGAAIIIALIFLFSGGAFVFGKVTAENDSSIPKVEEESFHGVKAPNGAKNILILGSDSREGETSRADSMMVLQLGGITGKPKLISFMRDMFVDIPGVGEEKLNAAYAYGGADLVRETLASNFGIQCQYYIMVDFQSFEKVIDAMFPNGVQIDAEKDMSSHLDVAISAGEQSMDGLTLLQYARFRMDEEGDFGRVRRQQQVMSAIFSQMKSPSTLLRLPYAAGKAIGYSSTNIPSSFLLTNSLSILKASSGFDRLTVPVDGSWQYGESSYAGSVLVIDKETNSQAIDSFLNN